MARNTAQCAGGIKYVCLFLSFSALGLLLYIHCVASSDVKKNTLPKPFVVRSARR
jgi:hypothetical protein